MKLLIYPILCLCLSCNYLGLISRQKALESQLRTTPSLTINKELTPENCFTIYGTVRTLRTITSPVAIAAFSFYYGKQEIVDHNFLQSEGYYSLFLPQGNYFIYAFSDVNGDDTFSINECCGMYAKELILSDSIFFSRITGNIDIDLSSHTVTASLSPFALVLPESFNPTNTNPYPSGTIRPLNDPLFAKEIAMEGVFSPAKFLQKSPIYFYASSPWNPGKVPVLFVHGYSGSPAEFTFIVNAMDTSRFQPWFFYYPSGQRLDRTGEVFYELFLSGKIIKLKQNRLVVFAHSMGGMVARNGLNRYVAQKNSRVQIDFISAGTPYGGNADAQRGIDNMPAVIPSWLDISDKSPFIKDLTMHPLTSNVNFYLFFTYKSTGIVKTGENSDGTIPLSSQLTPSAQLSALRIVGFDETHESILTSKPMLEVLTKILDNKL